MCYLLPGMAARASLITLPQALRPVQTALSLCLAYQKAWVRQADVLLTKHQQAKSPWPQTQADVLLTKHQHAKSLWPHKQDKTAEGKTDTKKLAKQSHIIQFRNSIV